MNADAPVVLLPIETVSRELTSHLVLASALAGLGCRVVVGHKEACDHIGRHSRGVTYLGKDLFDLRRPATERSHLADRLAANGSVSVLVQEEGGIFHQAEWAELLLEKHRSEYVRARAGIRAFVWGEAQRSLLLERKVFDAQRIRVTGCTRLDLCLPKYAWLRSPIQEVSMPYILVCTRFTSVAHHNGLSNFFAALDGSAPKSRLDMRFATWQRDAHDLADFVVLTRMLAAEHLDHAVVIRPHPSEDPSFYVQVFRSSENVIVSRERTALDWIHGAELVVHCNCTTGVEAVLAQRRVLNFLPTAVPRRDSDKVLANEAGVVASSIDDALRAAHALLGSGTRPQEWSALARSLLINLDQESMPLMGAAVAEVVESGGRESTTLVLPLSKAIAKWKERLRRIRKGRQVTDAYVAAKRGPLDATRIEQVLDGCRRQGVGTGRLGEFAPTFALIES